jgi:hypothetical protein
MGSFEGRNQADKIAGERRQDRRYQIPLELRWKLIRRRKLLAAGEGTTVDLSSGGLLFDAGRSLPAGLNVEISISWPVLLRDQATMQLVITGRIVRTNGNRAGVRMVQHEFRTAGAAGESRHPLPGGPLFMTNREDNRYDMLR